MKFLLPVKRREINKNCEFMDHAVKWDKKAFSVLLVLLGFASCTIQVN